MSKVEVCVSVCACVENHTVHNIITAFYLQSSLGINFLFFFELQPTRSSTLYTPEAKAVEVTTLDIREGSVLISLHHLPMYWGLKQLKIE